MFDSVNPATLPVDAHMARKYGLLTHVVSVDLVLETAFVLVFRGYRSAAVETQFKLQENKK